MNHKCAALFSIAAVVGIVVFLYGLSALVQWLAGRIDGGDS